MKKRKILFVYMDFTSFVRNDFHILKEKYDVIALSFSNIFGFLVKLPRLIRRVDMVFSYFAGTHAFLALLWAKLLQKKMVVVAGGVDAAYVPEINYGAFVSWRKGGIAKFVFENADLVVACTNNTKREVLNHAKPKEIEVVYDGIDVDKFSPSRRKKKDLVISVGLINRSNLKRKGMETFVKSAKYLPNIRFVLAGGYTDGSIDYLKSVATENVEFSGFLSDGELLKLYQEAKVYVQVSAHEAPGLALAEAMLCGCTPVVTNRAAIPEAVGNTGFYVPYDDVIETAEAIKKALKVDEKSRTMVRERIVKLFSLGKIEGELIEAIESVFDD